ncbi:MAG: hypothetical protein LBQ50_12500 [Planctomycetaceae bacterium]|jgi:hypothetical protein|nr:hypothetical protein [Planctomycetaceae bacterium]
MKNKIGFLFLFSILHFLNGCNFGPARPAGFPDKLYPCELTILQDGTPLQGARVALSHQDENKKNWGAAGISDAEGVVRIYTYGKWQGAPAGTFKVTVIKQSVEGTENKEITYTLIDEKFAEPNTTPLELEIKGKTTQTFDVGAAIKKKIPN